MKLEYILKKKNIKNMYIRINKRCEIIVTAPYLVSQKSIDKFVCEKSNWINKNILKIHEREKQNKIIFNTGDYMYYLGDKYLVKIKEDLKSRVLIDQENAEIIVYCKNNMPVNLILQKFIKKEMLQIMQSFLDFYTRVWNFKNISLTTRKMDSRWGSYSIKTNRINLNMKLIHYDISLIEYVFCHELTHYFIGNHSKKFYDKLSEILPDYIEREKILKNYRFN